MVKNTTRGEMKCTFRRKFGVMLRREIWENVKGECHTVK